MQKYSIILTTSFGAYYTGALIHIYYIFLVHAYWTDTSFIFTVSYGCIQGMLSPYVCIYICVCVCVYVCVCDLSVVTYLSVVTG